MKPQDKIFLAIGSAAILAAVGFGGYAFINNSSADSTNISTTPISSQVTTSASGNNSISSNTSTISTTSVSYKDGTYAATVNYSVPHSQQNSINVSLTVASGIITAVNTTNDYSDSESAMYIDSFESALQAKVVGKSISGASFSRIGGASLTTVGFQNALETIKNEAAA